MAPIDPAAMAPIAPAELVRRSTLPKGFSWEPLPKPAAPALEPFDGKTPVSRLREHLFGGDSPVSERKAPGIGFRV